MPKTDASVTLGLDMIAFQAGLNSAQKAMEATMGKIKRIAEIALAGIGVAFSAKMFADGIAGAIATGKEVDKLSREFQMAPKDILLMNHALDRSEQTMASTSSIMGEFREKMILVKAGVGTTRSTFENLLGSMEELEGLSLNEQFAKLAVKVNAIRDPLQRAAISAAVFGASGAKAVAQFQIGDLARAQELFGKEAKVMGLNAASLASAQDSFKRVQQAGEMFFNIITAKLAPLFETVATKLEEILPLVGDAAEKWGEKLMEGINIVVEAFKEGKIGEILWLSLKIAFMKSTDYAVKGFAGVFAAVQDMLGQAMSILATKSFWDGFSESFIGVFKIAANSFALFFIQVLEGPLKALQDGLTYVFENVMEAWNGKWGNVIKTFVTAVGGPLMGATLDKLLGGVDAKARSFEKIQKESKFSLGGVGQEDLLKNIAEGKVNLKLAGQDFLRSITESGASMDSIVKAFRDGMKNAGIFGPEADAEIAKLKELIDGLKKNMTPLKVGEHPRPGGAPAGADMAFSTINTRFDDLRKIGGEMGGAASDVGKQQLDVQRETRDILKTHFGRGGPARISGPSQLTGGAVFSFNHA